MRVMALMRMETKLLVALLSSFSIAIAKSSFPMITEHPISTTVPRSSPITLNCGVSGSPQPRVSWLKDGSPVKTGAGDHLMILPDGSLFFLRTVQNKKNQDSGEYRCQAENQHGAVFSNPATLTVTFLREKFGVVPTNIEALEGNDVKLSCLAPEGNPKPTIKWFKDGGAVAKKPDSSGSLILKGIRMAESGQYSCRASNAVGVRHGKAISVTVTPRTPPIILTAKLIDSTTGFVHWLPQEEASSYLVLVFHNGQQITNITVEREITQVKLHSLVKSKLYSVQVSAIHGSISTEFTEPYILQPFTESTIIKTPEEDIPVVVWVIAMSVVVVVTLLIIIAAAIICNQATRIQLGLEQQSQSEYGKTKSWINKRWNVNSSSRISSSGSNRGLIQDTHYDYAVPSDQDSLYTYSILENTHYASNSIVKPSSYLPISQSKNQDSQPKKAHRKQKYCPQNRLS